MVTERHINVLKVGGVGGVSQDQIEGGPAGLAVRRGQPGQGGGEVAAPEFQGRVPGGSIGGI